VGEVRILRRDLRRSAKPVEEDEENYCQARGYQRIEKKLQREKRRRMIQQDTLGNCQDSLVEMEKQKNQAKPADGMLGIDPSPHR